jgi:transposase-like protein
MVVIVEIATCQGDPVMHRNARLTVWGRQEIVRRVRLGRPPAHVAAEMGVSRATVYKWLRRFDLEGDAGLSDRSSRPRRCPRRTAAQVELRNGELRRVRKFGPARIGFGHSCRLRVRPLRRRRLTTTASPSNGS